MGNALSYLALFAAIPVGIALFFVLRPALAVITVYLGAMMFLPEVTLLDLPGLPGLGKREIAAVACILGCLLRARSKMRKAKPFRGVDLLFVLFTLGAVGTSMTNTDELVYGPTRLPALTTYESFSIIFNDLLTVFIPFFLGRALFTTSKELKTALSALTIAGVIYTPFLAVELVMSPQLHNWIYGFHQHDFIQTLRGGGYRPMVFMAHGLAVALFMVWAVMAGITLVKAKRPAGPIPSVAATPYVFAFLVACKSLGAAVYAFVLAPAMMMFRPKALVRIATFFAIVVFSYPILRATDIFPDRALVSFAYAASGDRAASLDYRFNMENMLSAKARERPVFGWGRFRRNMVFNPWGGEASVSDGMWIIIYGIRGGWGFVTHFALYLSGIFLLRKRLKKVQAMEDKTMLAGLALIVGLSGVDLIPNALFNTIEYLFCGILYGATKAISSEPPAQPAQQPVAHQQPVMHMQARVVPPPARVR